MNIVRVLKNKVKFVLAEWYRFVSGNPSKDLVIIGVTGTDGKTTTSNMIYHMLSSVGYNVGLLSTINAIYGGKSIQTGLHVTTPEPKQIQSLLKTMKKSGITHVVLETTSHGIDQQRVAGIEFDIAVLTNITHEHLDYHKTYENYRNTKAKLFWNLKPQRKKHGQQKVSILNKDDLNYDVISSKISRGVVQYSYSTKEGATFVAQDIGVNNSFAPRYSFGDANNKYNVELSLIGQYNISNSLATLLVAKALNIPLDIAVSSLKTIPIVDGRMETIPYQNGPLCIVDFAHTPNGMKNALQTARSLATKKVIVVFGSAAKRDVKKREMMGEIAVREADILIITAEDPRDEDLDSINNMILRGSIEAGGEIDINVFVEKDRLRAMFKALELAKKGDVIIALGKGHEQSMNFDGVEYPWDDRKAMKKAIKAHMEKSELENSGLPSF